MKTTKSEARERITLIGGTRITTEQDRLGWHAQCAIEGTLASGRGVTEREALISLQGAAAAIKSMRVGSAPQSAVANPSGEGNTE